MSGGPHHDDNDDAADGQAPDGRREPRFGAGDAVEPRAPLARRARARPTYAGRWWWLAVAVVALLLLVVFRQPLADRLWPQTRAQALRAQAVQALAQGRLTAADGSGARELFDAALAIDPDRSEAREGLMRVATAALAQARAAIVRDDFPAAHAALQLARELSVPRAQAQAVANDLRTREAAHAGIPQLLARAAQARVAGNLSGDAAAALPLYRRILALQPDNTEALKGREDVLADVLEGARAQLREGRLAQATAAIAIAREFDAGHVDLPDTQARLNEELDDVRRDAAADLAAGRLERAEQDYRLLVAAGQQADAQAGLERVAAAYAARAQRMAGDFRFADADAALAQARRLAPMLPALAATQRHIAHARQLHAGIDSRVPPHERARRVAQLLADAQAAQARGDLLTPPGDSAFDKLRAARALAPEDPAVRRASAHLLPAARECFERGLRDNDLARADACFDARLLLENDDHALTRARRALAQRWLEIGDERLGAGELEGARAALGSARALDPATPGLEDFEQRVRAALAAKK